MLPELATETVTRLRATTDDDPYGDQIADWTTPDELTIEGCSVQPVPGEEQQLDRDAVVSRWRWFGPYDADVTSLDRLEHDGDVYDIDGSVQRWRDPTSTGLDHSVALLRRTDG